MFLVIRPSYKSHGFFAGPRIRTRIRLDGAFERGRVRLEEPDRAFLGSSRNRRQIIRCLYIFL